MPTHLTGRVVALTALLALPAAASAQSIADFNVNPNAKTFAADSGNYGTRPSGGANGDRNPYFGYGADGNFYHSGTNSGGVRLAPGTDVWWYVDLGSNYDINSMAFTFRGDCCPTQNDGDWLELWTSTPIFNGTQSSLFSQAIQYTGNRTQTFALATPITARYVSLYAAPGSIGAIVLSELDVTGVATTATPEPATIGLFATGLVGLLGVTRRRRGRERA